MDERPLAGVEHLVSLVEGSLREDVSLTELLEATFPGGSITGAPKIAAIDHIAALEPVGRGASMGALGTIRPNGDLDLALTIRTFADRRRAHPPLGRRRDRVGLGTRTRRSRSRGSRRGRCSRRSAPTCRSRFGYDVSHSPSPGAASSIRRARDPRGRRGVHARARRVRDDARVRRPAVSAGRAPRPPRWLVREAWLRAAAARRSRGARHARARCGCASTRRLLRVYATPGQRRGPIALVVVARAAGGPRRAARARHPADLGRVPAGRADRRRQVDELRPEHDRRRRGAGARARTTRCSSARTAPCSRRRPRTSGGGLATALHAGGRARHPRRRDARACS